MGYWATDILGNWYTGQLIYQATDILSNWYTRQLGYWATGTSSNWNIGQLVFWATDIPGNCYANSRHYPNIASLKEPCLQIKMLNGMADSDKPTSLLHFDINY
jgi:hypothetical protein